MRDAGPSALELVEAQRPLAAGGRPRWRALPEEQREVIVLKEYQDLTFLEIAEALDVPVSTVKTRLYRGLGQLRQRLSARGSAARPPVPAPTPEAEQGDVMDCDAFRDDMLDVLYGEADEAAARRVQAHQAALRRLPRGGGRLRRPAPRPRRLGGCPRPRRAACRAPRSAPALGLAAAAAVLLAARRRAGLRRGRAAPRRRPGWLRLRAGRRSPSARALASRRPAPRGDPALRAAHRRRAAAPVDRDELLRAVRAS